MARCCRGFKQRWWPIGHHWFTYQYLFDHQSAYRDRDNEVGRWRQTQLGRWCSGAFTSLFFSASFCRARASNASLVAHSLFGLTQRYWACILECAGLCISNWATVYRQCVCDEHIAPFRWDTRFTSISTLRGMYSSTLHKVNWRANGLSFWETKKAALSVFLMGIIDIPKLKIMRIPCTCVINHYTVHIYSINCAG